MVFLSIILPCYQDHEALYKCLASLGVLPEDEVIVVDASETEAPEQLLSAFPTVQWLKSPPNRSKQLNLGAAHSTGDYLLFLHTDSILPYAWREAITAPLRGGSAVLSSFRFKANSPSFFFRVLETFVWLRCKLGGLPFGDQGYCLSKEVFDNLEGYPEQEIMEDYEFVRRLKAVGSIKTIHPPLLTSSRRWEKHGFFKTTGLNQWITLLYHLQVPPARLRTLYTQGKFKLPVDTIKQER